MTKMLAITVEMQGRDSQKRLAEIDSRESLEELKVDGLDARYQHRNEVSKIAGMGDSSDPSIDAVYVKEGDFFFSLTDGVTDVLTDAQIASIISSGIEENDSAKGIVRSLVRESREVMDKIVRAENDPEKMKSVPFRAKMDDASGAGFLFKVFEKIEALETEELRPVPNVEDEGYPSIYPNQEVSVKDSKFLIDSFDRDTPRIIFKKSGEEMITAMPTLEILNRISPGYMSRFYRPGFYPKTLLAGEEVWWRDPSGNKTQRTIANYDGDSVYLEDTVPGADARRGRVEKVPILEFLLSEENMQYNREADFTKANTPQELINALEVCGGVPGTSKFHESADLINKFKTLLMGALAYKGILPGSLDFVTNTGQLRTTMEHVLRKSIAWKKEEEMSGIIAGMKDKLLKLFK